MSLDLTLWQSRFADWMTLRQWSRRTIDNYTAELRPFFEFLQAEGVDELAALTRDTIEGYRTHLFYATYRGRPISLRTQAIRLNSIKRFTAFLVAADFLLIDPGAQVPLPRTPPALPRPILSERETEIVLESPDVTTPLGIRDRAMLEVFYSCAIRNSELRALALEDVDLEERRLRVRRGKGDKSRVVPMGEEAALWVREYLAHGRPYLVRRLGEATLFLTFYGQAFTRVGLARLVADIARKAGMDKAVGPHLLRHACATHMLRRGASVRHLQELLGHVALSSTQRYTRVEIGDLQRVHSRCHPRERGRRR